MNLTLSPAHLRGSVTPPPSKSHTHRLLIAAALASGESTIENFVPSEDLTATVRALRALGADIHSNGSTLHISGIASRSVRTDTLPHLDCGESGSTLRFLIPVALAVAGGGVFHGSKRLLERPLQPYFDIFQKQGIEYTLTDDALTIRGKLLPGEYRLPGNVSSQFFSGLFFALPLLGAPSVIIPDSHMESFSYIGMTLHTLSQFGIHIPSTLSIPPQYHIPSDARYLRGHFRAENDWSQAAFWHAAAGIGHLQQHLIAAGAQRNGDTAAAGRKLQGIGQQVPHQALHVFFVNGHAVIGQGTLEAQRHTGFLRQRLCLTHQAVQPGHQFHVRREEGSGLQQHRGRRKVVHQAHGTVIALGKDSHVALRSRIRGIRRHTQQRRVHIAKRAAQLSGHIGQYFVEQTLLIIRNHARHLLSNKVAKKARDYPRENTPASPNYTKKSTKKQAFSSIFGNNQNFHKKGLIFLRIRI